MTDLAAFLLARLDTMAEMAGEQARTEALLADQSRALDPLVRNGAEYVKRDVMPAAYVLADVEAKRRIVEWAAPVLTNWPGAAEGTRYVSNDGRDVLLILAQPFADHPGFDEGWRL